MEIVTDDRPTLVLSGAFDVRNTLEVRAALYDHIESTVGYEVVVDLSGVSSVDLTALKVLAVATRATQRQGRQLRLRGCRPAVRRLLHLSHLFPLVDVEREPISA